MEVGFLLLHTDIISDGQQMEGAVGCAYSQLLWVLLRVPVKAIDLDTCEGESREEAGAYAGFDIGGCFVIIVCAREARAQNF